MDPVRRVALSVVVCSVVFAGRASAQIVAVTPPVMVAKVDGFAYTYVVVARTTKDVVVVSAPASSNRTNALGEMNKAQFTWTYTPGPNPPGEVQTFEIYRTTTTPDGTKTTVKLATLGKDNTSFSDNGLVGDESDPPPASFLSPRVTPTSAPALAAGQGKTATYVIVARNAVGALTPSQPGTTTNSAERLDPAHYNDVAWNDLGMSQSYDVYRTAGGSTTGRIATVVATGAATYQLRDTGLAGDGGTPPDEPTSSMVVTIPSIGKVVDGTRIVSGVKGAGAKPHSIEVRVLPSGVTDVLNGDFIQRAVTSSINDDGSFAIALNQPLVTGQEVVVCARGTDDTNRLSGCHMAVHVDSPDDWGRVRAYFAAGVIFSQKEDNFSQQDLAMSFTLDKVWAMKDPRPKPGKFGSPWGRAFNTFFDARLTAVPVGAATTVTTQGAATPPATTPPAAAAPASGTVPTCASAVGNCTEFIASRKAALMQVGLYVPNFSKSMVWTHNGQQNAVFLAFPMARFGVVTTGAAPSVTTTASAQTPNSTTTTTTGPTVADDGVYKFYGFGFGVGHEKLPADTSSAPEVISYVNATFGKWENFSKSEWRMGFEGRLKIPDAPFQVGFDANLPMHRGPADVRIIVGMRFDFGELLGKLKRF